MEEWKDIQGWEGLYKVSSHGRIMSAAKCWGTKEYPVCKPETVMKLHRQANGYVQVHLKRGGGTRVKRYVHRLVAQAFLENLDCKPVVNHIDRTRTNNHVENLEWFTSSENNYYTQKCIREDKAKPEMAF